MLRAPRAKKWFSIGFCLVMLIAMVMSLVPGMAMAADEKLTGPNFSNVVDASGKEIVGVPTPVKPPAVKMASAAVPDVHIAGVTNTLSNVPTFDWTYGCSATSASMLFGYYDRTGYDNFYTGPTNSGIMPLDNSTWGHTVYPGTTCGENPMTASHQGFDGRTTLGHVDDYWFDYTSTIDPYFGAWTEHSPLDSVADFMGTNQYNKYGSTDGSTWFYFYTDGSPLYDVPDAWIGTRDGCHGMRLYAEYCGYTVETNYNQYIDALGKTYGFTFAQYMAEIDAGYPVLIQVDGHTMLGYGYDAATQTVYIHDTWDYLNHSMTWGGSYYGMQHYGVTVLHLALTPTVEQIWRLDSETSGYGYVMEKIGTQSGSVAVENSTGKLWISDQKATTDVVFEAGVWDLYLNTTDLTGNYAVYIGKYSDADGILWYFGNKSGALTGAPTHITVDCSSFSVPPGLNLGFVIINSGTGSVITDGTSYLASPASTPVYPLPELASGILAGLGLAGLVAFVVIKRRKSSAASAE
jgi:hypothetical protein